MREHILYTDADKDRPEVICDSLGSVVLGLCKAPPMAAALVAANYHEELVIEEAA